MGFSYSYGRGACRDMSWPSTRVTEHPAVLALPLAAAGSSIGRKLT